MMCRRIIQCMIYVYSYILLNVILYCMGNRSRQTVRNNDSMKKKPTRICDTRHIPIYS